MEFTPDFDKRLAECIAELPKDWHMLYMHGTERIKSTLYSDKLSKVNGMWGAFGYIVNPDKKQEILTALDTMPNDVDDVFRLMHPQWNCFKSTKPLLYHLDGYSYRLGKEVKYKEVAKK